MFPHPTTFKGFFFLAEEERHVGFSFRHQPLSHRKRCIISAAVDRQFSADGDSHRVKHLRLKDKLLCNAHRRPALGLLKRRDGTRHDDDVCVFKVFPWCPPVSLNPWTVYNHMDAVIMCSD